MLEIIHSDKCLILSLMKGDCVLLGWLLLCQRFYWNAFCLERYTIFFYLVGSFCHRLLGQLLSGRQWKQINAWDSIVCPTTHSSSTCKQRCCWLDDIVMLAVDYSIPDSIFAWIGRLCGVLAREHSALPPPRPFMLASAAAQDLHISDDDIVFSWCHCQEFCLLEARVHVLTTSLFLCIRSDQEGGKGTS